MNWWREDGMCAMFWILLLKLCSHSVLYRINFKFKMQSSYIMFPFRYIPSFLPSFLSNFETAWQQGKSSSNSQHLTTSSNGSNAQRGSEASSKKKKIKKKKMDAASEDLWAQWLTHYFGFNDGMTIAQLRVSKSWVLPMRSLDNFCCFVHAYEPRSTFESVCWILENLFYYPMMKFKSHFCIIADTHYSNNCHMALRTSSVPQVTTDSLGSLEFSSFSKISFHSKEYQSSDGARPKISGKVSGTVVDDDEGECNNTATEGESTNKDLSTQMRFQISSARILYQQRRRYVVRGSLVSPECFNSVPQLVVVFCCIILPS